MKERSEKIDAVRADVTLPRETRATTVEVMVGEIHLLEPDNSTIRITCGQTKTRDIIAKSISRVCVKSWR